MELDGLNRIEIGIVTTRVILNLNHSLCCSQDEDGAGESLAEVSVTETVTKEVSETITEAAKELNDEVLAKAVATVTEITSAEEAKA